MLTALQERAKSTFEGTANDRVNILSGLAWQGLEAIFSLFVPEDQGEYCEILSKENLMLHLGRISSI